MSDLRLTRRGKAAIALSVITFAVVANTALSGKNIDYSHGLPQVVEIGASK